MLMLVLMSSMTLGAFAATFTSKISIVPSPSTILVGQSVTFKSTWSTSASINKTTWAINGSPVSSTTLLIAKTSGTSSYTFKPLVAGTYTIAFSVNNTKTTGRTGSSSISYIVTASNNSRTLRYVSLGDSIATGTTSPLSSPTKPYTDKLQTYLQGEAAKKGISFTRSEFEKDGDRTTELWQKLFVAGAMQSAVFSADIITISIGGNNLMQSAKTWYGYDFFKQNVTGVNGTDAGYTAFAGTSANNYTDGDWTKILNFIRMNNQKAKIVVLNLYNPYSLNDTYMRPFVEGYFYRNNEFGMNQIIHNMAQAYCYDEVDIHTAFDTPTAAPFTLLYPASLIRNPHPTQYGQDIMYNLHLNYVTPWLNAWLQ